MSANLCTQAHVYELLELNGEMASALRRDDHESFTRIALASKQFEPLWQSVLQFASQGVTTLSEAMRISGDVDGGRRVKRSMDDRVVSV